MARRRCLFQHGLVKYAPMTAIKQLRNKLQTHGPLLTLCYCISFLVKTVCTPIRHGLLKSWSQAGEDRLLDRLMGQKSSGFYVDIGAHDPIRLSNTKRFYDRGWTGINIEPNPDWHQLFVEQRPRDINLCCGAGGAMETLTYYEMEQRALSTFDPQQVAVAEKIGGSVKKTHEIPVQTLENIFSEHIQQPIDFLSIDIEGLEYKALNSNDWNRWRPRFICIEAVSDENVREEPVLKERDLYFKELGYTRKALTRNFGRVLNAIYEDTRA